MQLERPTESQGPCYYFDTLIEFHSLGFVRRKSEKSTDSSMALNGVMFGFSQLVVVEPPLRHTLGSGMSHARFVFRECLPGFRYRYYRSHGLLSERCARCGWEEVIFNFHQSLSLRGFKMRLFALIISDGVSRRSNNMFSF